MGHVLRMENTRTPKTALRLTPPRRRSRGRPKTTWRRSVDTKLKEINLTWGEAEKIAKKREEWKGIFKRPYVPPGPKRIK